MFEKIEKILKNTLTCSYNFTVLTLLLIVSNGNIFSDGNTNKRERERLQRQCV